MSVMIVHVSFIIIGNLSGTLSVFNKQINKFAIFHFHGFIFQFYMIFMTSHQRSFYRIQYENWVWDFRDSNMSYSIHIEQFICLQPYYYLFFPSAVSLPTYLCLIFFFPVVKGFSDLLIIRSQMIFLLRVCWKDLPFSLLTTESIVSDRSIFLFYFWDLIWCNSQHHYLNL